MKTETNTLMNPSKYLALGLLALSLTPVFGQSIPPIAPPSPNGGYVWVEATNSLSKFDLNFPGGTPKELVAAIEEATGKPLNAIIPDDCANLKIPSISVKNMTVAQLFAELIQASKQVERFMVVDPRDRSAGGIGSDLFSYDSTYGFKTDGTPTENSIWFFYWDKGDRSTAHAPWEILSSKVCKFYQLQPYLEAGYKVEDVTTAVETAWKMLGVTNPPQISYHQETKVLIAVGDEDKVALIGDVLKQLDAGKAASKPSVDPDTGLPLPASK